MGSFEILTSPQPLYPCDKVTEHFRGRAVEVQEVVRHMVDKRRCITIVGHQGIGKTQVHGSLSCWQNGSVRMVAGCVCESRLMGYVTVEVETTAGGWFMSMPTRSYWKLFAMTGVGFVVCCALSIPRVLFRVWLLMLATVSPAPPMNESCLCCKLSYESID